MCIIISCSQFVDDSQTLPWMHAAARWQGVGHRQRSSSSSSSRLNTARRLMDVTIHYMHRSLNAALPLTRMPHCLYINASGLQHVITVIGSLWRDRHRSSLVSPQWGMLTGCGAAWHVTQRMVAEAASLVVSDNWCPRMLGVNTQLLITQRQVRSALMSNSWQSNKKGSSWDLPFFLLSEESSNDAVKSLLCPVSFDCPIHLDTLWI